MKKFHPVITNFLFNIPSYSSLNRVWIFSTPNQACFLIKKLKNLHSIYIQNCMPHFTIFQVWMFLYSCSNTSSVIRQKVESQNGGDKKTKHTKYLKKQTHFREVPFAVLPTPCTTEYDLTTKKKRIQLSLK